MPLYVGLKLLGIRTVDEAGNVRPDNDPWIQTVREGARQLSEAELWYMPGTAGYLGYGLCWVNLEVLPKEVDGHIVQPTVLMVKSVLKEALDEQHKPEREAARREDWRNLQRFLSLIGINLPEPVVLFSAGEATEITGGFKLEEK